MMLVYLGVGMIALRIAIHLIFFKKGNKSDNK